MKMLMPFVFAAALAIVLVARPAAATQTSKEAGLSAADIKAVPLAKDEVEAKDDKPPKSKKDKGKGNDDKGDDEGKGNDDKDKD